MDKWVVRFEERNCWWHVCDKKGHAAKIFSSKEKASDYCKHLKDLNRRRLGSIIKSWPNG